MAIESRGDLASRHGSIGRIAVAHSWFYRSDNPICTRTLSLDWCNHVDSDPALMRLTDLRISRADPSRAAAQLGWKAQTHMQGVVRSMVEAGNERLKASRLTL